MIKFGVKVQKETYTAHIGIEGGQKSQKNLPKKNWKGRKRKKKNQIRKIDLFFGWLVTQYMKLGV